jgi:hypothetical protein
MANSTTLIIIKPTAAFNRGDTFVFGSWVCTPYNTRSFQRYLTMTPDPKTGLVTLPEAITGQLAEKFDEFSLYNQVADFEIGSASNSNSTSPWIEPRELAPETSCGPVLPHEHFPHGLCNAAAAYVDALIPRRVDKEINSEFNFGLDPIEPESELNYTEEPLSGPATGLVITSTPASRFVYWPNRKPVVLTNNNSHCVAYLETLPFQEGTPLTPTAEEYSPTEVATTNSELYTPDREVFMATGEA